MATRTPDDAPVSGMLYVDEDGLRWHMDTRLPVAAYTSQAKGFFGSKNAGWAAGGFVGPALHGGGYDSPANRGRLLRAVEMAKGKACTANQIALAYLMSRPFAVFPIIGTSKPERAKEAMAAASIRLSEAECAALCG